MKYKWGTKIWHEGKVWQITELDPDSDYSYKMYCKDYKDIYQTGKSKWVKEEDLINTKEL